MTQLPRPSQPTTNQQNNSLVAESSIWYWLAIAVTVLLLSSLAGGQAQAATVAAEETPATGTTILTPNDPHFVAGNQYSLDLINVRKAWAATVGDPTVTVALIDTGIDYTNPELADHIHPAGRTFFLNGEPRDEDGHGTLTAGIIAATAHNNMGIAGIAPNVQVLPIKVSPGYVQTINTQRNDLLADDTAAVTYNFQEPIRYAADAAWGTKVININFATSIEDPNEGAAIYDVMNQGVLVVAAAGNSGKDVPLYPAAYDCVLGVGAVNSNAQRAGFSTYGLGVDVVAPGVSVMSTTLHEEYAYVHGTSFASPHVSGVAALIYSARPDLSAWDVREIIMRSAKDLGTPGFDAEYGYGLLDAGAALALAEAWETGSGRVLRQCTGDRYRIYGSLYFDANGNSVRDAEEAAFSEPYTNTTTFVELYAKNGQQLLDRTYPNHSGIYTFDVRYNAEDAPYLLKLQNSTLHQPLFFAANFSGPNDIDMLALQAQTITIDGTFFVDRDGSGLQNRAEEAYQYWGERPAQVALYGADATTPLALATGDVTGHFTFYVAAPTTTVTYTLRSVDLPETPQLTRDYPLVISPANAPAVTVAVGIDVNSVPVEGQDTSPNSTPLALQAAVGSNRVTLYWQSAAPLRADSIYEIAYATEPGGPYQTIATTATAAMHSVSIYDLPSGAYHFVVRAVTRDGSHPEFWSAYSNEASVSLASNQATIFLPIINN
jgi:subtilisin family serine protease